MLQILSLIFLLALTPWPVRAQQQDPPDKTQKKPEEEAESIAVETNLVVLNLTITDGQERYVTGLKREDFQLFEDKRPQRIASLTFEESPFTAAILLDASGSMQQKMTLARAACTTFVEGLREGDSFAIYSFSGFKVKLLQDFTEVRNVPDAVWDLKADGETPLYDGIVTAAEALAQRPERRRAIIIVSDGADTKSRASLEQALRQASLASVAVYAVDLSDNAVFRTAPRDNGAEVLKSIAARTGGRFYASPGGGKLRDAFAATIQELRNQYTLAYEPANEKRDGKWRVIEVKLSKPLLNVRTRQGYYAPKPRP